ncbi:response regulator transcription factor [Halomonas sp. ML-15]|uniref:response regulator transcription factor n=1 Tax=Halomonas sp. ML-15 TaxID=2773305 RepID=UPI0017470CC5|nr:response regulator transcription factor [Halomonas sp. ML-15]MBD3897213.1 response regulator transcription factor [Halomonas sp. ML-15]
MHIVIVEDDPRIRDFLQRGLAAEGHQVQSFSEGQPALVHLVQAARDGMAASPPVVILDRLLPDIGGLEVCRNLRTAGVTYPILMLTALDSIEDRVTGLEAGADDYLVKPFAFEELLARLGAISRRHAGHASAEQRIVSVGDLVLDRDQRSVTRAGQRIDLTPKELAILELLMSAPGKLFSRERILASVWGAHEDPLTNVVNVYIRRLRRKLDDGHAEASLITTQRGFGYRLEA